MNPILPRIERAISDFTSTEGKRPNVIIVGAQVETDLDQLNRSPGEIVLGLKIVADTDEPDFSLAFKAKYQ